MIKIMKTQDNEKFHNKYRIPSARLVGYDYAQNGAYFITICTKNRNHYFGKIEDGNIKLSDIGEIVKYEWEKTPELRPDMNITLDQFVVMPNHFHGIVIIGNNDYNAGNHGTYDGRGISDNRGRDAMHCVSNTNNGTMHCVSITNNGAMHCVSTIPATTTPPKITGQTIQSINNNIVAQPYKNRFGPQSKNLASIIRGFKIGVTKNARKINPHFAWQPRFHDHIIRNKLEYRRIAHYIYNNPMNWGKDNYF